jgi:hypothetical protein
MLSKVAENMMNDPEFLEMAADLQGSLGGAAMGPGGVPPAPGTPEFERYMSAMGKMFSNETCALGAAERFVVCISRPEPRMDTISLPPVLPSGTSRRHSSWGRP